MSLPAVIDAIPLLKDVDVWLPVPSSISAGTRNFVVTVSAQPRQDLTNPAPVYQATLGGVGFSVPKAGGTVTVAVPVTPGLAIRLVHTLNHPRYDMRTLFDAMYGAGVPLTLPEIACASAMSLICPQIESVEPQGGWTPTAASNVCLNAVNAIRAVTSTVNQSAYAFDTSIASSGQGNILFARPGQDRIVLGVYTVAFAVALNGYTGEVRLTIGGQVVYAASLGQQVYSWSPAIIDLDTDTDVLPVKLEGGEGVVVVSITSAQRTVGLGNLDGGQYATLSYPDHRYFRALQADSNPILGKITRALLAIEWFGGGVVPDRTVSVKWGGRLVGYLGAQSIGGQSVNKTVTVDTTVTAQGHAALPTQNISTTVSKTDSAVSVSVTGVAAYSPLKSVIIPEASNVPRPADMVNAWQYQRPLDFDIALPLGVVAGTYAFTVNLTDAVGVIYSNTTYYPGQSIGGLPVNTGTATVTLNGNVPVTVNNDLAHRNGLGPQSVTLNVALTDNQASLRVQHASIDYGDGTLLRAQHSTIKSITGNVNTRPTVAAVSVGGSSQPLPAQNLGNSGVTVQSNVSGNVIQITIPDSPRTTVTTFELPEVTEWDDMTGRTVEVEIGAANCPNVHLVQVQLAVEADRITRAMPAVVTGKVTGLSENPADVIEYLSGKLGEALNPAAVRKLRAWCDANAYRFARRVDAETDALTLRQFAIDQCLVMLAHTAEGIAPVRWLDWSSPITVLAESDFLEPAAIGWSERVETDITLKYREDYAGGKGWMKTLRVNELNNQACWIGMDATRQTTSVTVEGGFIRDDDTANLFLFDYARLNGQPRRLLKALLPYTFATLEEGELVEYDYVPYRITRFDRPDGWVQIEAMEVPR